jgi:transposase
VILEAKVGQHLPLDRLSETYAREGIELSVSIVADWVGACTTTLALLMALVDAHVLAAARLHGYDTTMPVLAKDRTITGRVWTYAAHSGTACTQAAAMTPPAIRENRPPRGP